METGRQGDPFDEALISLLVKSSTRERNAPHITLETFENSGRNNYIRCQPLRVKRGTSEESLAMQIQFNSLWSALQVCFLPQFLQPLASSIEVKAGVPANESTGYLRVPPGYDQGNDPSPPSQSLRSSGKPSQPQ